MPWLFNKSLFLAAWKRSHVAVFFRCFLALHWHLGLENSCINCIYSTNWWPERTSSGFLNTILIIFGFSLLFWCLSLCQSTGWNSPSWELRAQENCSPRLPSVLSAASISVLLIPQMTILPQKTVPACEFNFLAPSGTLLEALAGCCATA